MNNNNDSVLAPGATPQLVARQFTFTEGPAPDAAGNVYFTDQPSNRIWKWEPSGKLSIYMEPAGRSNGMFTAADGRLLTCADEKNELWSIDQNKNVTVLLNQVDGKKMNGPNDLWPDASGGIYFTDPFYKRPYWAHDQQEQPGEYVYYLPKGATQPVIVDSTLTKPNGIVGSPDGKLLYVADIRGGKTYRYEITGPGMLSNKTLAASMGSDGMTLDVANNLYITGNGVTVFNPSGEKIAHIPIPEKWTGNVCFGGPDRKTLFITASEGVYTVAMQVKGAW